MFEKEAEEIANKKLCSERICYNHCNFNSPKHHRCGNWHRIYECAKESAEFGYNKANEELEEKIKVKKLEILELKSQIKKMKCDVIFLIKDRMNDDIDQNIIERLAEKWEVEQND